MRLTRREFRARVKVTDAGRIFVSYGLITFETNSDEALELARALADAVQQTRRRGGASEC